MDFTSITDIIKNKARKAGRLPSATNISITQSYRYDGKPPVRYTTINIPEVVMSKARFKKGDRLDIAFAEDGKIWRLKVVPQDAPGYLITATSGNSKRGVIRFTWCDGIPLLGNDKQIIKVRGMTTEQSTTITPTEVIFKIENIKVDSRLQETHKEVTVQ